MPDLLNGWVVSRVRESLEIPKPTEGAHGVPQSHEPNRWRVRHTEQLLKPHCAAEASVVTVSLSIIGIDRPDIWSQMTQFWTDQPKHVNCPRDGAHGICATAKAEHVDLVSRDVVARQELVGI